MTLWLVRAGKAGEKEQTALLNGTALIGWEEVADLTSCTDRDELMGLLSAAYPGERRKTLASWQNQIWPIRETMQVGDLVALPLKARAAIAFGTIAGDYAYRTDLPGPPQHSRPVRWLAQVPRSEFDPDMLFSFGAFMTVCRIGRNDAEARVRALLDQACWPAASAHPPMSRPSDLSNLRPIGRGGPVALTLDQLEQHSAGMIRDRIAQRFKGHELARLVAALLEVQGYKVRVSPPGIDGGVDILAGCGPLGFDAPRLVVQVKSQDSKVDVRVLRELSGVMTRFQAEQGLLVGWGGFNQVVRNEAASDYFRLRLWEADDVVNGVIEHYARLPADIRAEIPLKQVWTLVPQAEAASRATAA